MTHEERPHEEHGRRHDEPERRVIRIPGIRALMALSMLGFAGYSAMLSTAPLWAVRGGADEAGAGMVNAVMMAATVAFQTAVPWALARLGWRTTLVIGTVLLGAPSLFLLLTDDLLWILVLSAVRGAGFAVLTVCGSSATAFLVEPARRGKAIGLYGLSIALPQLILVPSSVWIAEHLGFLTVFVLGAAPIAAAVPGLLLGTRIDRVEAGEAPEAQTGTEAALASARPWAGLVVPSLVLLSITTPGGALLTFAPQFPGLAQASVAGLFLFTLTAAATRWLVGGLADRFGHRVFPAPLSLIGALGLALCAWAVSAESGAGLIGGMALTGVAYGSLQNVTLVEAFAVAGPRHRDAASMVWNIGFDCGTGLGALLVGFIAAGTSFTVGLGITAVVCLVVALALAPRLLVRARM
ncbi:MFS transporter [Brevibacterium album]|uniref:MFS transporter n=1 Tax=Brevibacterium album TaxID=417948 RepID=UPI0006846435|nr:MFS transporter [Brevibacterium album]